MNVTDFLDDPRVSQSIADLKDWWNTERRISDVFDEAGNQYVDLVMEGGGVLGIALVGYTYALESVNVRFRHVGGTSAGAINALMVAALDTPDKPKSEKVLGILSDLDLFTFVDGDRGARRFIRSVVERSGWFRKLWTGLFILDNVRNDLGLDPGKAFRDWLTARLTDASVESVADLKKRMTCPALYFRNGNTEELPPKDLEGQLKVVAADVTTNTKAVFPEMASLYWRDPPRVNPAHFVRASMSIPLFFHPMRVTDIPQGPSAVERWSEYAGYRGSLPREVLFVDGGIVSNFPIDLFHSARVPRMPTLGVKLGIDRNQPVQISRPTQLCSAIFDTARQGADYGFLRRNRDYRHLVAFIQTGDHNWLDFQIDRKGQVDLFARGVQAASRFLMGFDWAAYKEVRRALTPPFTSTKSKAGTSGNAGPAGTSSA